LGGVHFHVTLVHVLPLAPDWHRLIVSSGMSADFFGFWRALTSFSYGSACIVCGYVEALHSLNRK
jgi:hypothetical protein